MDEDTSTPALGNDQYTKLLLGFDDTYYDTSDIKHGSMSDGGGTSFSSDTVFIGTKGGGKSMYFSSSTSSYLYIGDHADWYFDGDFTIDAWVKTEVARDNGICGQDDGGTNAWHFKIRADHYLQFGIRQSSSWTATITSSSTVPLGEWAHVAVCRSGSTWYFFINGQAAGSTSNGTSIPNVSGNLLVGDSWGDAGLQGYLDDFRISKGIARWTSAFTPHSEPYGGHKMHITGGTLLDTSIKKFGSASMYFDGVDTLVQSPSNYDFDLFSENFTIDCWVRFSSLGSGRAIVGSRYDGNNVWGLVWQTNNVLMLFGALGGTNRFNWQCPWTPVVDTWYHVAVVRNGSSCLMFIDGVSKTVTDYESGWGTWTSTNAPLDIGLYGAGTGRMHGYMDELRISKGIARWTSGFSGSLPTTEYVTDYFTKLLLHFKADESGQEHSLLFNLETQFMLEPTKWNGSFHLDGNDYMRLDNHADWDFGSGNFTIDLWVRLTNTSGLRYFIVKQSVTGYNGWCFRINNSSQLDFNCWNGSTSDVLAVSTGLTWNANQWYHVAAVRNGNTFTVYRDGTSVATDTFSGSITVGTDPVYIGVSYAVNADYFEGYMDEVRISDAALWTTNFTPPTEPESLYYISGQVSSPSRMLTINEASWTLVDNTTVSGSTYEIAVSSSDDHSIIGRRISDGYALGYGNVTPQ